MSNGPRIAIQVACATPLQQRVRRLEVAAGTTARQAALLAGLQGDFPDLDIDRAPLGIYGELVADDYIVAAGDRVEIYRPLKNDPRELRRRQAARAPANARGR
jgi:putative ubiquitin-RnfH superfamily antitoxin RatB of RatAB toxin-antitoxin module